MPRNAEQLVSIRSALGARGPGAWLTTEEACLYLGCTRNALRCRIARRELTPDGRGPRRAPWFFRRTLDAHLRARRAA